MEKKYIVDCNYYSASFNGAIFDGPIRLYFAQQQEQQALEFFHHLSTTFKSYSKEIKQLYKSKKRSVYFFMYPTLTEKQEVQPKGDVEKIFITPFIDNYIVGFNMGSISCEIQSLETYFNFICQNWLQGENQQIKENFKTDFLLHLS